MGLANVAAVLAHWGYRVLAVDWDFEAPGLEYYLFEEPKAVASQRGMLDLLEDACRDNDLEENCWHTCRMRVPLRGAAHHIDMISVGSRDEHYHRRLRLMDLETFYAKHNGGLIIEQLGREWRAQYDFVLIDSRTGVSELNGICTVQLPDLLVLFCTSIGQSLEQTPTFAQQVSDLRAESPYGQFQLSMLPLLSRFDVADPHVSKQWLQRFVNAFGEAFSSTLPRAWMEDRRLDDRIAFAAMTKLPYVPLYSFGEQLLVNQKDRDPAGLPHAYETLAAIIVNDLGGLVEFLADRDAYVREAMTWAPAVCSTPPNDAKSGASSSVSSADSRSIFLSYADDDQEYAEEVIKQLRSEGFVVYYFTNPGERRLLKGEHIERVVMQAGSFLSLLSPAYMASQWSQLELSVAETVAQFKWPKRSKLQLFAAKIRELSKGSPLQYRRQIDLTDSSRLPNLVPFILPDGDRETKVESQVSSQHPSPATFHNRQPELTEVIEGVARGNYLVQLVSMPTMGKSCFLRQLPSEMLKRGMGVGFKVVYVDLDEGPPSVCSDLRHLLTEIFRREERERAWSNSDAMLGTEVAETIRQTGKQWVILLDEAEQLLPKVAREFRMVLSSAIASLKASKGLDQGGLLGGLVAASRMELSAFKGLAPQPSFRRVVLEHFKADIATEVLEQFGKEAGIRREQAFTEELARVVWETTEGLPALFDEALSWIRETRFELGNEPKAEQGDMLFDRVVRPYVEKKLLSANVLLPARVLADVTAEKRAGYIDSCVELALGLSAMRVLNRSHVTELCKRHPKMEQAWGVLQAEGREHPYEVLSKLSVIQPNVDQLWLEPYRAVRRLYFRYRYVTVEAQLSAHEEAQQLAKQFSGENNTSFVDQARFPLERLWHEVERTRLSGVAAPQACAHIKGFYDEVRGSLSAGGRRAFDAQLLDDEELQQAIEMVQPELFGQMAGG